MPVILTTLHDPRILAVTCRQLGLSAPVEGCLHLATLAATGWIVRLTGLREPVVCDTLTGLVAYHPVDNAFRPYGCLMRFVHRYYDVRHRWRTGRYRPPAACPSWAPARPPVLSRPAREPRRSLPA